MGYGTGAIFGCPAHDARDLAFARKYHLTVTPVVHPRNVKPEDFHIADAAFTDDGVVFNSDFLNGLAVNDAKKQAIARLEALGLGKATITYRLRDYGGYHASVIGDVPSPIIHCDDCGLSPFQKPTCPLPFQKMSTLANRAIHLTIIPHGNTANAQFVASPPSVKRIHWIHFLNPWYFARFSDAKNPDAAFDPQKAAYWLPVDQYVGGIEHAVCIFFMHGFSPVLCLIVVICKLKNPFQGYLPKA